MALHLAFEHCIAKRVMARNPLLGPVAAVSCGLWQGQPVLDLDYAEDNAADTDANFVLTGAGGIVEIQASAEAAPFSEHQMLGLLALAKQGTAALFAAQQEAIA